MKRSLRHRAVCAAAFAGALWGSPAWAQERDAAGIHFEWRAPEGCSSFEGFAAHVRRRSSRIVLVPGPAPRHLIVEIAPVRGRFRGLVRVVGQDGIKHDRRVEASSCAEAVEALSLIATVALDPDALLEEPEPEAEPEPFKPVPALVRVTPKTPLPAPVPPRHRVRFGLAAAVLLNQAPELGPGASMSVSFEANPGAVLSPLIRLSLTHAQRRSLATPSGKASFAFTLPTVDLCPVRLGPPALALRPCAFGRIGIVHAWGSEVARREQHVRAYSELGGAVSAGLRISELFEIIGDIRAAGPLRRDQYAFDNGVFFTTPSLTFSAELGVAYGFP